MVKANPTIKLCTVFSGLLLLSVHGWGQGIKIYRVCGFDKVIDSIYLVNAHKPKEKYEVWINAIVTGLGRKNKFDHLVVATQSANVPYAITGLAYSTDKKTKLICIVINEDGLDGLKYPEGIAILSHEIGHITDGDMNDTLPITSKNELAADYQSGFASALFGVRPIDLLLAPYMNLQADAIHPPFAQRSVELTDGYHDGTFSTRLIDSLDPEKHHGIISYFPPPDSAVLDTSTMELAQFITPTGKSIFSKTQWYKVAIRVISTSPRMTNLELYSHIKEVQYFIDEPTFPHQHVTATVRANGYQYLLKSWGDDYKVYATVVFDDGSKVSGLSITVKFPDLGETPR